MSEINALLQPIETRIERLEGDHGSKFATPMDAQLAAWEQVRATLLSANESYRIANALERIADLLEQTSIENDDGTRTLYLMAGVERVG